MNGAVRYQFDRFPPAELDWSRLIPLMGPAHAALARFDGQIAALPNPTLLLAPLLRQEAQLSSQIEGTTASLSDVYKYEQGIRDGLEKRHQYDADEILNYEKALKFAADTIKTRPLSLHLLREAHAILMSGVRGFDKEPGAFRSRQNRIGAPDCTIDEASYVPISQDHLQDGLDRWATFVADTQFADPLVQLAIVHFEFEALHPFMDGNGRLGRMLIPLFLFQRRLLQQPNFYMSGYFEAHRQQYIDALQAVSRDGAWTCWCAFFLEGIKRLADENYTKAKAIGELNRRLHRQIAEVARSQFAPHIADYITSMPLFSSSWLARDAEIPPATARRLLGVLCQRENDILRMAREPSGRRPGVYVSLELLRIIEGDQATTGM